jgi:hypothetical protein
MTAPEPTRPADEHTEAVAEGMCALVESTSAHTRRSLARRLLASTDPAVHEALAANLPADVMLAALVRAGVLTEFRIDALLNEDGSLTTDAYIEHCNVVARQFVTSWEVAP